MAEGGPGRGGEAGAAAASGLARPGGARDRKAGGKAGEDRACAWLEAQGMAIIARNFRSVDGEVDIVAQDGETLVFVEVKAWSAYGMESLERGIDGKKRRRIIETAKYFLFTNRKYSSMAVRFDVVFINQGKGGQAVHFPSAFTEDV